MSLDAFSAPFNTSTLRFISYLSPFNANTAHCLVAFYVSIYAYPLPFNASSSPSNVTPKPFNAFLSSFNASSLAFSA